jgi:hypothetical protein
MPFCTNCGSPVKETDLFCGECGAKITKKEERVEPIKKAKYEINLDNVNLRGYYATLSWVLDQHINALIDITKELIPYFDSLIIFEENNIVSVGNSWWVADSSPELLLYRMPLAAKTDNIYTLNDLAKYTEREISQETKERLPEKFQSLIQAYESTLDPMEAIYEATRPIRACKEEVDRLFKQEDLKNVDGLMIFDKCINEFMELVKKTDWTRYPQGDLEGWRKRAADYGLNAGIFEDDISKMACPYCNDLGIDTDIERCIIAFYTGIQRIQDAYDECRDVFIECTNRKGIFGGIPGDLKTRAVEKLTYLNMYLNALYYPLDYCNDKSDFFENNLRQFKDKGAKISVSDEKSLRNIFNIISMLNGVYPVNMKWGPVVFSK